MLNGLGMKNKVIKIVFFIKSGLKGEKFRFQKNLGRHRMMVANPTFFLCFGKVSLVCTGRSVFT